MLLADLWLGGLRMRNRTNINVSFSVFDSLSYVKPTYIIPSLRPGVPPDHLFLDSAPNVGPLISRWKINKFENC
jgi:hypothetical protein